MRGRVPGSGLNPHLLFWAGSGTWYDDPPVPEPVTPARDFGDPAPSERRSGLVCGRFLPPHAGHRFVLDVARQSAGHLTALIFASKSDPIPAAWRAAWLREMCPGVQVGIVDADALPDDAAPDFVQRAAALVREHVPDGVDDLFASDLSAVPLAEHLKATFVPVDPARRQVPISGSELRADVMAGWHFLPEVVRPWFVRRVAIIGPFGSGKSTLAERLADYFDTVAVPEVARAIAEGRSGALRPADVQPAARGQVAQEEALARRANRILICDTSLTQLCLWSAELFRTCPPWIEALDRARPYDLTLITPARSGTTQETNFRARCVDEARVLGRPFVPLQGSFDECFSAACEAIEAMQARRGLIGARFEAEAASSLP